MIKGSCLCGSIHYEINGPIGDIVHCHCTTCRKAHGSAFSSVSAVADENFKILNESHLKSYESSQGKFRYFCGNCGSQIYAKRNDTQHIILRLGTLDTKIEAVEKEHIWVSEKADWCFLNSKLPQKEAF